MATVQQLRASLMDKIQGIESKEFLEALNVLVVSNADEAPLTEAQKVMLRMSEEDLENNRLISQEDMDARNLAWHLP